MDATTINPGFSSPSSEISISEWRALQYFNCYRLLLAITLFAIYWFNIGYNSVEHSSPIYSFIIIAIYFLIACIAVPITHHRLIGFKLLVITMTLFDIAVLILLMNIDSSIATTLAVLINITIAGSSILVPGRLALLFAAIAFILLGVQQIAAWIFLSHANSEYLPIAFLGISFFATAMVVQVLTKRLHNSVAIMTRQSGDLEKLERFNSYVIERMKAGVLVIDKDGEIQLLNNAARRLLQSEQSTFRNIRQYSPMLAEKIKSWRDETVHEETMQITLPALGALATFVTTSNAQDSATLVFLENLRETASRAQEMKLASLGRFTASMAHELRNPLSAISHAVQLLQENPDRVAADKRLLEIVEQHTERMNGVIKNILQLSRRTKSSRERINLNTWTENFVEQLKSSSADAIHVDIVLEAENQEIYFDPSQFHQVMLNLCENGLRYSKRVGEERIFLKSGSQEHSHETYIDVIDYGPGIPEDKLEKLFEPFYTTERTGTGLGLYIAYELCQANQARLEYLRSELGACFRITFQKEREL